MNIQTISLLASAAGIAVNTLFIAPARADWAAIAYLRSTGSQGTIAEVKTAAEAAKSALNICGKSDCQVILTDERSCIAVAAGGDGVVAGGGDPEWASDAEERALESCNRRSSRYCRVVSSTCSNGGRSR